MHRLICFDPGLTLGVAIFHDGKLWEAHAIPQDRHVYYLSFYFSQLVRNNPTTVVCEDFVGRYLTSEAKATIKLIGQIEWITMEETGSLPIYQRAQKRISFIPQAKALLRTLTRQEKWLPHHIDAVSQGLAYLHYSKDDTAVLAPDLCLTQGEADEPPTAREA